MLPGAAMYGINLGSGSFGILNSSTRNALYSHRRPVAHSLAGNLQMVVGKIVGKIKSQSWMKCTHRSICMQWHGAVNLYIHQARTLISSKLTRPETSAVVVARAGTVSGGVHV